MSYTQNDVDQLLHPPQASLTTAKACAAGVAVGVAVSSKSKSVYLIVLVGFACMLTVALIPSLWPWKTVQV